MDLKLNTNETPPEVTEEEKPVVAALKPFQETTPAYWSVKPTGKDTVEAFASRTGETFTGTVKDFNKCLRGA